MDIHSFFTSRAFLEWAIEFVVVLFLVGGFVTLAVGLCLAFNSAGTLQLLQKANRWISTRRALKPIEIPRDTTRAVYAYRYLIAAFFIGGGALATYYLARHYDTRAAIQLFGLGFFRASFAAWVVDSARYILLAGNAAGIVVGIMLGFFPGKLMDIEARGAHWYSERTVAKGRETMNFTVDNWVAKFPRASGWIITVFALVLIGAFGMMLTTITIR